ncbi:MAG: serine/threonine-protein phosphatase, partial [Actinomycetota bacterium]|nr:serine/threonine-protein phosphatase [Actinomycetota bacterium]
AASTMGQLRSITRAFALGDDQSRAPGDVLTRLNRNQLALGSDEMFTVLYAIIDPALGEVSWANAGHPPPLLHRANGEGRYLEGGDGLMGIDDIVYTDLHERIGEDDTLIFYTDGLVERRGESLDDGLARLARAVAGGPADPEALRRHIVTEVVPAERTPSDDVTIVLARTTRASGADQ